MNKSHLIVVFAVIAVASIAYAAPGDLKWRYETWYWVWVYSSPAISPDGTLYFGSSDYYSGKSYLYALTPEGSLKWRYPTGFLVTSSPAIGPGGVVYFGSDDYYLYALTPEGSLKWRYQTGAGVESSPAIGSDGTIYVGSYDHYLYALTPEGSLKWRYQTGNYVFSSPAIGTDGTVYFGSDDSCLYALTPQGNLKWRYQTGDWVSSSPAIGSDGTLYFGSNDGCLYALTPEGSLKWRYQTGDYVYSSPTIGSDGSVYFGSYDSCLYALTPQGALKWRYQTGDHVKSSPTIGSDGTIYVGSYDHYLYALTPQGALRWRYKTGGDLYSSSAIGPDGTIYVGSLDGCLYAIESSSMGLAASPWPKFHHDNRNTGRYSLGVYATTIVAPQESASVHSMTPAAYFTNTNVEPAKDFYCHCEIWPKDSDTLALLSPPYHSEYWISYEIEPGDSVLVKFSPWLSDDSSLYTAKFYATDVFSTTRTINFNGNPTSIAENPQPSLSVNVSRLSRGIKVSYTLPEGQAGVLRVYNVTGQRVAERAVTSSGEVELNQPFPKEVYFVRLDAGALTLVRKAVVIE